jgi:hypothetical protein
MPDLQGQLGELRMTVEVKRAATGETETYELVGYATKEQADALGLKTDPED